MGGKKDGGKEGRRERGKKRKRDGGKEGRRERMMAERPVARDFAYSLFIITVYW
jgi:hypothetical protein